MEDNENKLDIHAPQTSSINPQPKGDDYFILFILALEYWAKKLYFPAFSVNPLKKGLQVFFVASYDEEDNVMT